MVSLWQGGPATLHGPAEATLEAQNRSVLPIPAQCSGLCSPFTSLPSCALNPGTKWFDLGQASLQHHMLSVLHRDNWVLRSTVPKST